MITLIILTILLVNTSVAVGVCILSDAEDE